MFASWKSVVSKQELPFLPTFIMYLGFISPRPPPRNAISEKIASATKLFVHLRAVRLTPVTQPEDLVSSILPVLCDLRTLDEVIVNNSCANEERSSKLVQLGNLRKLDLISPGRAILQLLPDWLSRISKTLVELHLMASISIMVVILISQLHVFITVKLWICYTRCPETDHSLYRTHRSVNNTWVILLPH